MFCLISVRLYVTRKSSCVNARAIPTVVYQVLHLFTEVGYPLAGVPPGQVWQGIPQVEYPLQGYPLARSDRGYPRWGTPSRGTPLTRCDGGGTQGGVLPWQGTSQPDPMGGTEVGYPLQGTPSRGTHLLAGYLPARSNREYLRWVPPDRGTPWPWVTPGRGTPWTWLGYPLPPSGPGWGTPLGVDRQTDGWMVGWMDGHTRVKT